MYVCICRAVTEAEVLGCIADGACTIKDVIKRSEAGTGCGSCVKKIAALLSSLADELPNTLRRSA
ncbi:MAG TPA: (2Fe-2S)-binding protein [Pseudonocardiaceae bacterium]|jgi:bacterioferritin-associated ferredoxin|nr:(2Fe-2S)-binding protein [Pseudonocardiaceae bacterium]